MYAEILDKIRTRLDDTFRKIPAQHLPEPSPQKIAEIMSAATKQHATPAAAKSATPFTPIPVTPTPGQSNNASAISAAFGGSTPGLKGIF